MNFRLFSIDIEVLNAVTACVSRNETQSHFYF